MRPGQAAPECILISSRSHRLTACFNEAGAGCPGMPSLPPLPSLHRRNASMRPGQAAPECVGGFSHSLDFGEVASMRPGQAAPECLPRLSCALPTSQGFNEAGAGCPGMLIVTVPVGAAAATLQ